MLLNRDYFISSFNETEDLETTFKSCQNVIHIVPVSKSEKEKLQRNLEEVYLHFKKLAAVS